MPKPSNHLFEVEITANNIPASDRYIDFIIPAWRSGRYVIFNFSSAVQEFSPSDDNSSPLKYHKIDKSTWRVETSGENTIKVKYKIYANEFSNRTKGLNDDHAFIDPSSVFMYSEASRHNPLELKIIPFGNWHVTTGLDKLTGIDNTFIASDYDYFADCPIIIGNQKDFPFTVDGKQHNLSITGEGNYNAETIISDLTKIVEQNKKFWGGLPYEHFDFMFQLTTQDYGGTEHMNSFVIDAPPLLFKNKDSYNGFLSTCSHEFFHTWNVKRLRPKNLAPYDFTKENYTEELWIAEGTTSYYQSLMLLKAGYKNQAGYLMNIQTNIENYFDRPGNQVQTLAESSFDAWVKYWGSTPNKWVAESDYYSKGANVSMLLDLEIRHSSANKYSLDNVMRTMYERFPLSKGGYTNADFIKVCEEYAGTSLTDFFDSYLYGLITPDWGKYLNYAGLKYERTNGPSKPGVGISTRDAGDRLIISYVSPESPAYDAGLNADDEIVAMNGLKVNSTRLMSRIGDMSEGDTITFTIMRNDKISEFNAVVKNRPSYNYSVEKVKNPTELQKEIYESWLNTTWE